MSKDENLNKKRISVENLENISGGKKWGSYEYDPNYIGYNCPSCGKSDGIEFICQMKLIKANLVLCEDCEVAFLKPASY